tara:strand:+ start:1773 stop:2093 length:321 start_codon:yes stop_codon:yes gene_type:complete
MTITVTWEINNLKRDLADGYVSEVIYRVKGLYNGEEKARATGSVGFVKPSSLPSDFKEYDTLTESDCLTWVKDALGSDEVTAIENRLTTEINELNTPITATGKPWS